MPSSRKLLLCLLGVLSVLYGIAWLAPATGLAYTDGALLVALGFTAPPPAFLVKLIPLACTVLWLVMMRRLLMKMGATETSSLIMVAITAASPTVIWLATGLFPQPLFALLATVSLLALLEERPVVAGFCAGLATLAISAGLALILASLITLMAQRRLRPAMMFTFSAMAFAAPGLGWALAHGGVEATKLHLSELAVLLFNNAMLLAAAPFTLLSGYANLYPGLLTAVALLIVLVKRRHFMPDLFVAFYCLILAFRVEPPLASFAPVLPLFLWMLWRVARIGRFAKTSRITALVLIAPALWFGVERVATAVTLGAVTSDSGKPNDWRQMQKLFAFIRANTPTNAVILADLDPVFALQTGRRTLRGFVPDNYRSYYGPPTNLVTPDQLENAILQNKVDYVAVTPDHDLAVSESFHKAVAALERGGVLEPVAVPGTSGDYTLLLVKQLSPVKPLALKHHE